MKVKIFEDSNAHSLERNIQQWLEEHKGCTVVARLQSQSDSKICHTIYYLTDQEYKDNWKAMQELHKSLSFPAAPQDGQRPDTFMC